MPDFALTDQRGKPLTLTQFAGRAVVLSFNDDQCKDLCTLLALDVAAANRDLGPLAKRVAFVSINANPYYPSVAAVKTWTDAHGLGSADNWYFGTGSAATLAAIAQRYGVPIALDPKSRVVEHGAQLFFIDPKGVQAQVGGFGTGAASTALFGHAMAELAVSLLPANARRPIGGPAVSASVANSAQLGAIPTPAQLPALGTPSVMVGTAPMAGKYEVINFWASTCTACVQELPQLQSEFVKDGIAVEFTGVDVSDPAEPRVVSVCPPPVGDFCDRGLRFGPHNTHENRPGSYRSAEIVFVTYFNAGLRVYDVSDAERPTEIASWIPPTPPGQEASQINDVFVSADLDIYVTDRVNGGVYVVRPDEWLATRLREAAL